MDPLLAVFLVVAIGGVAFGYGMYQFAAREAVESWAKEKNYRLIDLKPVANFSSIVGCVTFDATYETASGVREEVVATYSRTFGGSANSLWVEPKNVFKYNKY